MKRAHKRSAWRALTFPALFFGLLFGGLASLPSFLSAQFDYMASVAGFCFGLIASLGIVTFEYGIKARSLGRLALAPEILFSALLETAFVVAIFEASLSAFNTMDQASALSLILRSLDFVIAVSILGTAMLILQMVLAAINLVGGRSLLRFLGGYYRLPKQSQRFVLAVSLCDQAELLAEFGQTGYLGFLDAFQMDLERAAYNWNGEIYHHVEAGTILHWRATAGEANNDCVGFVFRLHQIMGERAGWYKANFHRVPSFRASLHFGDLYLSEVGGRRKEILCSGVVLATLAKLDHACERMAENFLVSDAAMDHLILPTGTRIHRTINARLRDESESWRIFALEQIPS